MTQPITTGSQVRTKPRHGTIIATNTVLCKLVKLPNGRWLRNETTTFQTHLVQFANGSKEWFHARELEATDDRPEDMDVCSELGSAVVSGRDGLGGDVVSRGDLGGSASVEKTEKAG